MRFLSRPGRNAEILDALEGRSGPKRSRLRRWLAPALTLVVGAGAAVAIALPAHAGISNVRVIEKIFYVQPFSSGSAELVCDKTGEKVISGGALIMSFESDVRLTKNIPSSRNYMTWYFEVQNPTWVTQEIHGRIMCATNVPGYYTIGARPFEITHNAKTSIQVKCFNGYSIAGGYQIDGKMIDKFSVTTYNSSPHPDGWNFGFSNINSTNLKGNARVICTSQGSRWFPIPLELRVAPGTTDWAIRDRGIHDCRDGQIVVGGGWTFSSETPWQLVTAMLPSPAPVDYWKMNVSNRDKYTTYTVRMWIVCLPEDG